MAQLIEERASNLEVLSIETDLGKLREAVFDHTYVIAQKYLDKAAKKYGDKFRIDPLIESSTAYIGSEWRTSRGFGIWTFGRYGNTDVGIAVQGTLGDRSGKFIVLADGSIHSLTEKRSGSSNLTVDAEISTFSEPDLFGKRKPLYPGVEKIGEIISVSNNNTENPDVKNIRNENGIFALGAVLSDQANTKIKFMFIKSSDPADSTAWHAECMAENLQGRPQRARQEV